MSSAVVASFPQTDIVLDMARLSHVVYHLRKEVASCHSLIQNHTTTSSNSTHYELPGDIFRRLLPKDTSCLYYNHDYSLGRQILIVRNRLRNYIAVAYAGTDDWRTAFSDSEILTEAFGPSSADDFTNIGNHYGNFSSIFDSVPDKVRVHSGFNNDVFANAGFSTVLQCISSVRQGGKCNGEDTDNSIPSTKPYRLYTTGHSLGAASSVILGAALHLTHPSESVQSINFGSPKIGNLEWSTWIDTLQPNYDLDTSSDNHGHGTYEIFRFVNKIDLVPRLPDPLYFKHAGHTLQMRGGGSVTAYFDHVGNEKLGFAGVPRGWGAAPYVFLPGAIASHMCSHYLDYLYQYRSNSTPSYVDNFELIDDSASSDDDINPPYEEVNRSIE